MLCTEETSVCLGLRAYCLECSQVRRCCGLTKHPGCGQGYASRDGACTHTGTHREWGGWKRHLLTREAVGWQAKVTDLQNGSYGVEWTHTKVGKRKIMISINGEIKQVRESRQP